MVCYKGWHPYSSCHDERQFDVYRGRGFSAWRLFFGKNVTSFPFIQQPRIERSFELDILSKNFRMKQKKIEILPLTAIAIWLQVVGILKLTDIDGGFDILTLETIFNFPPTCDPWKNEEEEIGGHTVERAHDVTRAASYTLAICWSYRVVHPMGGYAPGVF